MIEVCRTPKPTIFLVYHTISCSKFCLVIFSALSQVSQHPDCYMFTSGATDRKWNPLSTQAGHLPLFSSSPAIVTVLTLLSILILSFIFGFLNSKFFNLHFPFHFTVNILNHTLALLLFTYAAIWPSLWYLSSPLKIIVGFNPK